MAEIRAHERTDAELQLAKAEIAERDQQRLDVVGIEQDEEFARLVAIDEDVGTEPAA
jgi:hypothetical protein